MLTLLNILFRLLAALMFLIGTPTFLMAIMFGADQYFTVGVTCLILAVTFAVIHGILKAKIASKNVATYVRVK